MTTRWRRRAAVRVPLLAVAAVVLAALSGPAPRAHAGVADAADGTCDDGAPDGWTVIQGVNTDSGNTLICNFRVDRTADGETTTRAADAVFEDGTAITIEYFCSSDDGLASFAGKTGQRDTETFRSDTKVITEEGPKAKNKDNPQPEPIFSNFFSTAFDLQEKAWVLFNSQVVATLYVLTNERGAVAEDKRFGVDDVEVIARGLAADNAPSSPDCAIPPIDGGGTRGGGGPGWVTVAIGTVATVTIGSWVWRRRRTGSPGSPTVPAAGTPPPCYGIATSLTRVDEELDVLREARQDVAETLAKAKKIHAKNLLKARVAIGWEIFQAFTGPATDLALALRPGVLRTSTHSTLGQMDNWHPPGSISSNLRELIERAKSGMDAARKGLQRLMQNVEQIKGVIENSRLPLVQAAQAEVRVLEERLGNLANRLPLARKAREELSAAEDLWEISRPLKTAKRNELDDAALRSAGNLANAQKGLADASARAAAQLGKHAADDEVFRLQGVVHDLIDELRRASPGAEAEAVRERLAQQRALLTAAENKVTSIAEQVERTVQSQAEAVARHQADATKFKAEADAIQRSIEDEGANVNRLFEAARQYSDFDFKDPGATVEAARAAVAQAKAEVANVANRTDPRLAAQLAAAQQQLAEANADLANKSAFYDAVKQQISAGGPNPPVDTTGGTSQRSLVGKVASAVWYPVGTALTMTAEVVLGVGQSPKEIWDILVAGQENIRWFEIRHHQIERAIKIRERTSSMLRERLSKCTAANTHPAGTRSAVPVGADR